MSVTGSTAPRAPTFSVVIATYGRGALIEATLLSVARQTLTPSEILVVSDGPAAVGLAGALEAVSGARLIELPVRTRTQSGPNNEGWRQATGEWIAYLGHDDIWHPEHLDALASAVAGHPEAGFAVSGLVFLGPDRDSDDETWVTGFFDDDDLRAPREEFFPPSSFAHHRDLDGSRWPDAADITLPVDAEFLRQQAERGARFVSTRRITVIKFASGLRYLSYLLPDDAEQRWILGLGTAALDDFLASRLAIARERGTFMHMKQVDPARFVPGEIAARNERIRGIDVGTLVPLGDGAWVPIGTGDRPPDWYPLESDDLFEWRWSGPSVKPKLLIPYTAPESMPVRIGLHVVDFCDERLRDEISVRVNGTEQAVAWLNGVETRMVFTATLHETRPTVVEILTSRTAPQTNALSRPVGIAVTGFDLEPESAYESRHGGRSRVAAERELELARRRIDVMSRQVDTMKTDGAPRQSSS